MQIDLCDHPFPAPQLAKHMGAHPGRRNESSRRRAATSISNLSDTEATKTSSILAALRQRRVQGAIVLDTRAAIERGDGADGVAKLVGR